MQQVFHAVALDAASWLVILALAIGQVPRNRSGKGRAAVLAGQEYAMSLFAGSLWGSAY